jgi:hypothetical protein
MRTDQATYDRLLCEFRAESKPYMVNVRFLMSKGYTYNQAKNGVHVYLKGGSERATTRRSQTEWDRILDNFRATEKSPKECVDYLRVQHGATYRQASSAVYRYRKTEGLITSR